MQNRKILNYIGTCLLTSVLLAFNSSMAKAYDSEFFELKTIKLNPSITPENVRNDSIRVKDLIDVVEARAEKYQRTYKKWEYKSAKIDTIMAEYFLGEAKDYLGIRRLRDAQEELSNALIYLKSAQLTMMPSRIVEARGMFLDASSIPKTKDGIVELIKTLKKANFNIIYPEIFRRGYTIIPTPLTEIDPEFEAVDFDVLKTLVEEAHNNDMEVHPWVWTFRVKSPEKFGNPFLSKFPALAAVSDTKNQFEPLFLSPALPQSRELIIYLLKNIATNYNIDGLMLDYIRYDERVGNDLLSKTLFKIDYLKKNNKLPPENLEENINAFIEWQLWKENQVTQLIEGLQKEILPTKPDFKIGASVFRGESYSRLVKMQNWRNWADNQYINYISPMLYTNNTKDLDEWLNWETDNSARDDMSYPTLGAHRFTDPNDIFPEIGYLINRNILGENIFALIHFDKNSYNDLAQGVFKNQAYLPHKSISKSIKILLDDTSKWLKDLSWSETNLPSTDIKNLSLRYASISKDLQENNIPKDLDKELCDLKNFVDTYKNVENFTPEFLDEIKFPITYSQKLLKVYQKEIQSKGKKIIPNVPPLSILPGSRKIPRTFVSVVYPKLILDGRLNDSFWEDVESLSEFYWHNGISKPEAKTTVKLGHDTKTLYIAFENFESNIQKVENASKKLEYDSSDIFDYDSVEIYIQNPDTKDMYHFVVSFDNNMLDEKNSNKEWNSHWTSATKNYENKWTVEITIPFEDIGFIPKEDSILKANFVRSRYQEINPYSVWSPTFNGFNKPDRFGSVIFR